ncbi:hypothetical protein BpHYR1_027685 [Brachionus plicatilis]|uniref:Uncharacterized protein n=1 Tax=Brachionus plicatilis TaxID=10195 RepID=A0A3M7QVR9_BRAPC|nr:hypothetical protein BpHYR1_027685 [Brachionus plicatilis]
MLAFHQLVKTFAIAALQWNAFEQHDHDQVEAPHFVRLTQAVDSSHLSLHVRVAQHTLIGGLGAGDHIDEVLLIETMHVLAQLHQKPNGPFELGAGLLVLKLLLKTKFVVVAHAFVFVFEVLALGRLQVEPVKNSIFFDLLALYF